MSDERRAKLPGFPAVTDANLAQIVRLLVERAEVREGARGSELERVVTQRDLQSGGFVRSTGQRAISSFAGVMVTGSDGAVGSLPFSVFESELTKTKLYANLVKRLDDVTRFDDVPEKVRNLLLNDLSAEAAKRGADIQRVEYKLQSAEESIAYTMQEVTAAIANASAGVREVTYASATANQATAGKITQLVAALDGTGSASLEESLVVIADRTEGLSSQYMLKLNAGGAVAGIGLMASEDPTGATESSFIVQADKFAIVGANNFMQAGVPTSTAIDQTWYNTDTKLSYRAAAAGATTIAPGGWVLYTPVAPFGVDTVTNTVFINGSLRINAGGATIADSVGKYTDYIFRRSASAPGAPTVDSPPDPWFDTPPSGANPLYMSVADKTALGVLISPGWSTPVRLDGSNGGDGTDGTDGIGIEGRYTESQYAVNSSPTTAPTSGFTSTQPTLSTGQFMWMQIRTVTPPAAAGAWGTAVRISGEKGDRGSDSTTPGDPGTRGTVFGKIATGWDAAAAALVVNQIVTAAGGTPVYPIKGDIVYYTGGAKECTVTGYPGTWAEVAAFINGSLVVTGTIATSKVMAGLLDGFTLQSGTGSTPSSRAFEVTSTGVVHADNLFSRFFSATANSSIPAVTGTSLGTAVGVWGSVGGDNSSTNAHGVRGTNNHSSGGKVTTAGLVGTGANYDFYAEGAGTNYGPFTGAHDALVPKGSNLAHGDIVVDLGIAARRNTSNTIAYVGLSTTPNQKAVVGVVATNERAMDEDSAPAALKLDMVLVKDGYGDDVTEYNACPEFAGIAATHNVLAMNALGEGQVNVCGEGGNIAIGDLIVSSSLPGKGMRQADDLVRSYTVAKCRENVTFSSPTEVKMVACIYLCG